MVQYISYLQILGNSAIQLGRKYYTIFSYDWNTKETGCTNSNVFKKADSTLGYANINPQNFPFRMERNRKMFHQNCFPTLLGNMPLGGSKRKRKG
jgi:hypothetical protein